MSIPPKLPPRAPAMIAQVKDAEAAFADLEAKTPLLLLAKAEMQSGAHKAFTTHEAALKAARADLDDKTAAAEAAAELDREADRARVEMLRNADVDDLLEGFSATDCCDGCSATECMIAPGLGRCAHPKKGGLPIAYGSDPVLRRLQGAAHEELQAIARGDYDCDDEQEDEAA
jgi:membrane protein involved in colicin uptake